MTNQETRRIVCPECKGHGDSTGILCYPKQLFPRNYPVACLECEGNGFFHITLAKFIEKIRDNQTKHLESLAEHNRLWKGFRVNQKVKTRFGFIVYEYEIRVATTLCYFLADKIVRLEAQYPKFWKPPVWEYELT